MPFGKIITFDPNIFERLATGEWTIKDGGITTSKIADGAITTSKIADDAVTNDKLNLLVYEYSNPNEISIPAETVTQIASVTLPQYLFPGIMKFYIEGYSSTGSYNIYLNGRCRSEDMASELSIGLNLGYIPASATYTSITKYRYLHGLEKASININIDHTRLEGTIYTGGSYDLDQHFAKIGIPYTLEIYAYCSEDAYVRNLNIKIYALKIT